MSLFPYPIYDNIPKLMPRKFLLETSACRTPSPYYYKSKQLALPAVGALKNSRSAPLFSSQNCRTFLYMLRSTIRIGFFTARRYIEPLLTIPMSSKHTSAASLIRRGTAFSHLHNSKIESAFSVTRTVSMNSDLFGRHAELP